MASKGPRQLETCEDARQKDEKQQVGRGGTLIGYKEGNSLCRVVTHEPGEMVGSPSLESFEPHLAEALHSLIYPQSYLSGLDQRPPEVLANRNYSTNMALNS